MPPQLADFCNICNKLNVAGNPHICTVGQDLPLDYMVFCLPKISMRITMIHSLKVCSPVSEKVIELVLIFSEYAFLLLVG